MQAETMTFAEACRENTGAHILDSGSAYGRHHEQPPISKDAPVIRNWRRGDPAIIETAAFLDKFFTIQRDLQKDWEQWDSEHTDLSRFESGRQFMEEQGYFQHLRDNVYNSENDLSQVFVYEVYDKQEDDTRDCIYKHDDTITIIYVHTGCDVRGGYGRPIFCKSESDYVVPVDLCAQYRAIKGWNADGTEIDRDQLQAIDENWQNGYSSYPYGELDDDVAEWHEDTRTDTTVEVTLKSGERVLVQAEEPYIA